MIKHLLLFLSLSSVTATHAQNEIDTAAIVKQLDRIFERDQVTRTNDDSAYLMLSYDRQNLAQVELLIAQYGWMGTSFVGERGNVAQWLVIQHADLETQEKYLPLLRKSVAAYESRPSNLALMEDRVLMRHGKKQLYGSQISINPDTGAQEVWQIEDEKNVNVRRAALGMEPMEDYAKRFGIDYKLPTE
jgi:hypothetical protein